MHDVFEVGSVWVCFVIDRLTGSLFWEGGRCKSVKHKRGGSVWLTFFWLKLRHRVAAGGEMKWRGGV